MSPNDGALTHSFRELRKVKDASRPSAASSKETRPPVSASTRLAVVWSGCAFREGWLTFATLGWEARRDAMVRAFSPCRASRDDAGRQVAVSGEVFGRAVDHYIRAELERALKIGGAEGVVHDQGRPGGAGYLRDLRYVGDAQQRVGDRFDDHSART